MGIGEQELGFHARLGPDLESIGGHECIKVLIGLSCLIEGGEMEGGRPWTAAESWLTAGLIVYDNRNSVGRSMPFWECQTCRLPDG